MCFVIQDETVDLRQIYLSVAALSGFVSFKSLLHTAFTVSPTILFYFHLKFNSRLRIPLAVSIFKMQGIRCVSLFLFCFPAVWQRGQRQSECRGAVQPPGGAAGFSSAHHSWAVHSGLQSRPAYWRWGSLSNELSITNLKTLSGLSGKPPGTSLH